MPIITNLHVYPVKSLHGIRLKKGKITTRGLQFDRNWMIIDQEGKFLTQRKLPEMAAIRVSLSSEHLHFEHGKSSASISTRKNYKQHKVTEVWGDRCEAFDEGDNISQWLSNVLGQQGLRLLRFRNSFKRRVDADFLDGEDAHTAFTDGFPFLITSEESLTMLNDRLAQTGALPITMDRFRPNIVIKGLQPFQENEINELQTADGTIRFGLRKPCKRCKVTTVDQKIGKVENPTEPLRTLTAMKTVPGLHGAYFGQNATLLTGENKVLCVDDELVLNF